ncbi:MAG: serine/threonine-protein kinase [Candidatus Eremiobacteraeota bacterium]|nr:serine/threonine-protein kinase [Candidatus Eremiobacteraeota bacterium]
MTWSPSPGAEEREAPLGTSGRPFTVDFRELSRKKLMFTFSSHAERPEQFSLDLSSLKDPAMIRFILRKEGYHQEERLIPVEYLRTHAKYPGSSEEPIRLRAETASVIFTTSPPGAAVFVDLYSARGKKYLGLAGEKITLDKSPFRKDRPYSFYFQREHYEEKEEPISIDQFKNDSLNYYPGENKAIALRKSEPAINYLYYWGREHAALSMISATAAILALGALLFFIIIPRVRAFLAHYRRLSSWQEASQATETKDPMCGTVVGGFAILDRLGEGGMGTVYRAVPDKSRSLEETVALKIIKKELVEHDEYLRRFRREMKILSSLSHPNILQLFDFGDHEGQLYLVTELVSGKTLGHVIPREGMALDTFSAIFLPVLRAAEHAHQKGVIHRDLKPGNIIITDGGKVKVIDFGLAKGPRESTITMPGQIIGTPEYMAPEQVSLGELDARTDQYALGIIAYRMLTGRLPFDDEDPFKIVMLQLSADPPPLASYRGDLPPALIPIVMKMLAKEPDKRFRSLAEVSSALEFLALVPANGDDGDPGSL